MKKLSILFLFIAISTAMFSQNYCPCSTCENLSLDAFNSLVATNKLSCGKTYRILNAYHFTSFDRTVDVEVLASSQNTYYSAGYVVIGSEHIEADIDLTTPTCRIYEGSTQMVLTPEQCHHWDDNIINEAFQYVELYVFSPNTSLQLLKISLTDDPVTFRWSYVQNMQTGQFGDYDAATDTFTPY